MSESDFSGALKKSQRVMQVLESYSELQLNNKLSFKANLHSVQGNAHLELGDCQNAAKHHQMDLDIGEAKSVICLGLNLTLRKIAI